jgi:two-component system chemotaxis sensor kinase CheA
LPELKPVTPEPQVTAAKDTGVQTVEKSSPAADSQETETTLRVQVNLLETLMNLAGELVLSRNQLLEALARSDQRAVQVGSQRINLVTSELQEAIMQTRMQPIGSIFTRFPRLVRDLSKKLGKDIQLLMDGKEVEMDKTIVEGLSDPLTHMVRNAIDHGLESATQRSQAGKPTSGTIRLNAYHEAGQVVVEISDDGRGIDPQKTAASALAKGLISKEQLKSMSEKEMIALILLPGVSTADKVTDTSGRGVGMDVVKANLDRLGGKLEIDTQPGQGTIFRIKLPLTLAIIPSLLVSVNEERYAIPQASVNELIRVPAAQVKNRIEVVGEAEVLVLRGTLIPLVHLASVLGVASTYLNPVDNEPKIDGRHRIADRRSPHYAMDECSPEREPLDPKQHADQRKNPEDRRFHAASDLNIVVVNAGAFRYGLVVAQLHDTVEIVVKPLGRHLKGSREYAGATIMGDGHVALILDAGGLATKIGLTSFANSARARELDHASRQEKLQDVHSFLLFRNAPGEPCAVPLSLVSRVEQINNQQIEEIAGQRTMQYRGASLPLVMLKDAAAVRELDDGQARVVIVFDIGGREIGLLAAMPVDVVETATEIDSSTLKQQGIMGSAIIKEQTTLIVDIFELVTAVHPQWVARREPVRNAGSPASLILLAEDSDFFRNQIRKTIESDGYTVLAAVDGEEAWNLLQQHADEIRMVVTDIEMPRLTGLELTRNLRGDQRFQHLPVIALTSLASEEDAARGVAAGVTDYQIKLDKLKLLASIRLRMATPANVGNEQPA